MFYYEYLFKHDIFKVNLEYINPFLVDSSKKLMDQVCKENSIRLSGKPISDWSNNYHVQVFLKASNIIERIQQLEQAIVFIEKAFPKTYSKNGFTQIDWLRYHYSSFIIAYRSIVDIVLIFVNYVLCLQIEERKCSFDKVITKKEIKGSQIEEILTNIKSKCDDYGHIRNKFVHYGDQPDLRAIADSEILDFLLVAISVNQKGPQIIPIHTINQVYKSETKKIIKTLEEDIFIIQGLINNLFDNILEKYILNEVK